MGNKRPNSGEEQGSAESKKTKANSQISINSTVDYNIMDQNGTGAQQPTRQTCTSQTCMFFGSASTEGYCSVCYKIELKKREENLQKSNTNQIQQNKSKDNKPLSIQSSSPQPTPTPPTPTAISSSNSIKINSPNSSNIISPNSTSASIANSAPVPIIPTSTSCSSSPSPSPLGANITTPIPSSSSKRRNDDSICSTLSELEGTPTGKKTNSDSPSKPKKKRCGVCKKKLGLTGFPCHCGLMFCPIHRYADQHGCTFDYATAGKDQLRKDNPVVQDEKIVKF